MISNRVFVPLRAVGEALGAEVSWDQNTNTVFISTSKPKTSSSYRRPEDMVKMYWGMAPKPTIVAPEEVHQTLEQAMNLLWQRDNKAYRAICAFFTCIEAAPGLGKGIAANTYGGDGICRINTDEYPNVAKLLGKDTAVFYAVTLYHEAVHAQLRAVGLFDPTRTPDDEEAVCYLYSVRLAEKLNAPSVIIDSYKQMAKDHFKP
jgi:hypothetical protein